MKYGGLLFRSGTDFISLLILLLLLLLFFFFFFFFFVFFLLFGRPLQKNLRQRRFKSDRDEILQDCSSSKYASIDGDGFSI